MLGELFRMIWSSKYLNTNIDLYVYPDSNLILSEPEFDELVLPGPNYNIYPAFRKVY